MSALYLKIASEIRENIDKGLMPVGSVLSERKLAALYGTGRSTITAALSILKDDGYVEASPKSGTRVSKRPNASSACWDKFVRTGTSASSTASSLNTVKYMTFSGRAGMTFGMHSGFEPYKPLRLAFESLSGRMDMDADLNKFDIRGIPQVRHTIADHLKTYGIEVSPDNIITFNSYLDGVYNIAMALLSQGANLYCAQGDMILNMATVRSTGANFYEIPVDDQGPVVAKFEQMLQPKQMNMLYINPVNSFPTGLTYSKECMDALMAICEKYNVAVVENDFLRDIWIKTPPEPMKVRNTERVIYIGTMANSYATGLRLGWAAMPDMLVPRIADVKMQTGVANNSGVELIVNEMLSKGYYQRFMEDFRKKLPERVAQINTIFEKYLAGLAWWYPDNMANTIVLEFDAKVDINRIIEENPCFMLPAPSHSGRNAVFTNSLGMTIAEIEQMAAACAKSLKKY